MNRKTPELIERTRLNRDEIGQVFTDAACWNENHRLSEESAIDPDGDLKRAAEYLDNYLASR